MKNEDIFIIIVILCGIQLYRHTRLGLLIVVVAPIFALTLISLIHYFTHDFFQIRWEYRDILNLFILGAIIFFPDWKKIPFKGIFRGISNFLSQKGKNNKEKLDSFKTFAIFCFLPFLVGIALLYLYYFPIGNLSGHDETMGTTGIFLIFFGTFVGRHFVKKAERIERLIENQIRADKELKEKKELEEKLREKRIEEENRIRMIEAKNRSRELELEEKKHMKSKVSSKFHKSIDEIKDILDS